MPLTELVPPQTKTLTSLARVKLELGLLDNSRDELLTSLITEASALIIKEIGYPVWRARIRETLVGHGRSELLLNRTPIVRVESVSVDGSPVQPAEYDVDDGVGVMFHENAWQSTRHMGVWLDPYERPDEGRHRIEVDYWAGVLGPDDNIPASGIGVDGDGETFVIPTPPLVVAGDVIEARGFGETSNNGRFIVTARSETGITVEQDLTTEIAPATARLIVRNLDAGLERLCIQAIKSWVLGAERDPAVTSERIGDWSATFGSSSVEIVHELPPGVLKGLEKYRRIV